MRRPVSDSGVAAVLILALASVLALVGALTTSLAAVAVARQRAAAVADLAALAAASHVLTGPAAACVRAAAVAQRNGGRLTRCRVDGERVDVWAEVRPPGVLGGLGVAQAQARAGPGGPRAASVQARAGPEG